MEISSEIEERTFPHLIAEWPRNSREVIRVALDQYNGRFTLNIRVWYRDQAGELRPGKTGVTLALKHLPEMAAALSRALDVACSDETLAPFVSASAPLTHDPGGGDG